MSKTPREAKTPVEIADRGYKANGDRFISLSLRWVAIGRGDSAVIIPREVFDEFVDWYNGKETP